MTDPDAVARALARLATGAPRSYGNQPGQRADQHPESDDLHPQRVVADAEAAMERVDQAAAFLDAEGESRLRRAIQAVEAGDDAGTGDDAPLAARGRAVLTTLSAFRAAATDSDGQAERSSSAAQTTSTALAQRSSGEGS